MQEVAASYTMGALGGLVYLRMLHKHLDSLGGSGNLVSGVISNQRLLVPVVLVMAFNRCGAHEWGLACHGAKAQPASEPCPCSADRLQGLQQGARQASYLLLIRNVQRQYHISCIPWSTSPRDGQPARSCLRDQRLLNGWALAGGIPWQRSTLASHCSCCQFCWASSHTRVHSSHAKASCCSRSFLANAH